VRGARPDPLRSWSARLSWHQPNGEPTPRRPKDTSGIHVVIRYTLAFGLAALGLLARFALAPQLDHQLPYATFFVAVVLAAFFAGPGPTLLTTVLGYLAVNWFVMGHAFGPRTATEAARSLAYLTVCGAAVVGSARVSRARHRAETSRADLEREIADRKRAEEALRAANRAKDEFLGMLSHELRNPLAPIQNSLYILDHAEPTSQAARRAKEIARRQLAHLTRLVDDLLDVTRIVWGKVELRSTDLDLAELTQRIGDDHRDLMRQRGIRFDIETPSEQVWVNGDETRLTQVVGNLLQNAARFTGEGGLVAVSVVPMRGIVEVRVRDTGSGIDPELLANIFTPFVQGKQSLARTEGGLGLGLALVKGLVELHGGTVAATSAGRDQGSVFTVRLPLAPPAPASAGLLRQESRATPPLRVLVVDDNKDAAESLADVVRMLGHKAEVAFDGWTAVEGVKSNPPDIVLCDIGLPGMSGYQVARALRADQRLDSVQLIAVSGYARPEDRQRALDAGFAEHIAKPADAAKVLWLLQGRRQSPSA